MKVLGDYTLGNMTLLTQKMNGSLKNSYFDVKKKQYAKTKLPMTLRLAALETFTEEHLAERHKAFVEAISADIGIEMG